MYPHYNHLSVPTWIIGPALGEGPLIGRPADVLKVWRAREPIQRLPPAQFDSLRDQFVAVGRKNWLLVGSERAGPRVAAIISIVETCRRLSIPVRNYLGSVLPGLANFPINRIAELTPSAWAARI